MLIEIRGEDGNRWASAHTLDNVISQLVARCEGYRNIVRDYQERLAVAQGLAVRAYRQTETNT